MSVDTGELKLEVGGVLQHAGVCGCVQELQRDYIQHQNMHFIGTGGLPGSSVGCKIMQPVKCDVALLRIDLCGPRGDSCGLILVGYEACNGAVYCQPFSYRASACRVGDGAAWIQLRESQPLI